MDLGMFLNWALVEIMSDHYNCDCCSAQRKDKRGAVEKGKNCCMPLHRVVMGLKREKRAVMLSFLHYPCICNTKMPVIFSSKQMKHIDEN